MSFKRNMLAVAIATAFTFPLGALAKADPNNIMQAKIEPFVDVNVLSDFTVGEGSQLQLSPLRAITGGQSLQWDWHANSSIVLNRDYYIPTDKEASEVWGRRATPLFSFFIYNEKPIDDYLVVDFGHGLHGFNQGDVGTRVHLNFTGWRAVGVSLTQDTESREIDGFSATTSFDDESSGAGFSIASSIGSRINSVRFLAPSKVKEGRFFIDHIMLSVDDARYQWSDYHVKTRLDEPEVEYYLAKLPNVPKEKLLHDVNDIEARFRASLLATGENKLATVTDISKLVNIFNAYQIKKDSHGVISGRHVLTGKQKDRYQPNHLSAEDKARFDKFIDLADYTSLMYNISRVYNTTTNQVHKEQLADMYLLLTEHLIDQGFVKGSALITTHHWGYSSRWWYLSAFLMQDVLKQANLKQTIHDALLWYSREFRDSFTMRVIPSSSDLDYFNTLARQHLALLLLEPDDDKRIKLVNSYAKYLNGAISQTPSGTLDGFRPDGTMWRHDGNYPGYAFPALPNATQLTYLFKGTAFELDEKAFDSMKKALLAARIYSNPRTGIGLSGRHPFKVNSIYEITNAYRNLALASHKGVDEELAAIYLSLAGKNEKDAMAIFGKAIKPAALPQGFWSFNGGAFGIHRYKDKMVTLKAFNSNVWSSEIYRAHNRYGRYQSHGSAQILSNKNPGEQGYLEQGWDWNRLPGVTSIHLPLEKLNSPIPHTLMVRGIHPYSGTSTLNQRYGMMAFRLGPPNRPNLDNFDYAFRAQKTVLAADDHLIMVGSNINTSNNNKDVQTSLFQLSPKSSGDTLLNGKVIKMNEKVSFKTGDWLIDGAGNGYLITNAMAGFVTKQNQRSAEGETRKPTEGVFNVAWLDHSNQPNDASYEYMVLLDATPAKMQALANDVKAGKLPYTFEQKAGNHIIRNHLTKVTGYALYNGGSINDSLLDSVDQAAIVMVKDNGEDIDISGVTPDLNISNGKRPRPITINVNLKGSWKAITENDKVKVSTSPNSTTVTFTSYFGIPQEIKLQKK